MLSYSYRRILPVKEKDALHDNRNVLKCGQRGFGAHCGIDEHHWHDAHLSMMHTTDKMHIIEMMNTAHRRYDAHNSKDAYVLKYDAQTGYDWSGADF